MATPEKETLPATVSDVEARLGDAIDPDEVKRVEDLIEEATVLVEGYLGSIPNPVPRAVRIVVSRMVARVLQAPDGDGFNAEQATYTAGPFSKNVQFTSGASGGAPWLTTADKTALRKVGGSGGIYTVSVI